MKTILTAIFLAGVVLGVLLPGGAATRYTLQAIGLVALLEFALALLRVMQDEDASDYTPMTLADAEAQARLDEAAAGMNQAIDGLDALAATGPGADSTVRRCRVCGCTDDDCAGCIERTGEPCHWVEFDLCSACADGPTDRQRAALLTTGPGGEYVKRHHSDSIIEMLGGTDDRNDAKPQAAPTGRPTAGTSPLAASQRTG